MSGYSQKMLLKLKVLMHTEQFCDVEIIVQVGSRLSKVQNSMLNVQGRHILCHKVVLASASEYFENMFRSLSISSHIIFSLQMELKDCCRHSFKENSDDISRINLDSNPLFHQINSSVVVAVVNFIYTGTHWFYNAYIDTNFTSNKWALQILSLCLINSNYSRTGYLSNNRDTDDENSLSDIFCLAHQWLLEDLVTICTKLMSERVNASNVFQLLDFAKQYDNDSLSNCAKRFLATNLPNVLWRDEFCKVEEEVILEVFSDPIIFCHDDYAWLEAVRAWADDSEEKLERLLPAIPLHLLSAEEKEKIYKDQTFSKTIKSHIEKVNEDTEVTRSVVQYIPIDMFSLNEEPGWLMHTMKDKIVIERMEQFCKTDDHSHLSRGGVERAMQAFYGSNCYMFFESECPASNNRYLRG